MNNLKTGFFVSAEKISSILHVILLFRKDGFVRRRQKTLDWIPKSFWVKLSCLFFRKWRMLGQKQGVLPDGLTCTSHENFGKRRLLEYNWGSLFYNKLISFFWNKNQCNLWINLRLFVPDFLVGWPCLKIFSCSISVSQPHCPFFIHKILFRGFRFNRNLGLVSSSSVLKNGILFQYMRALCNFINAYR